MIELLTPIVGSAELAETVVQTLSDENLLHIGFGDADVDMIIQKFVDTFGTTKTTKQDRWAASRLAGKYGSQAVCGIIGLLGTLQTQKYAPVVNSVVQFEEKIPSILNFLRSTKGDEEIDL